MRTPKKKVTVKKPPKKSVLLIPTGKALPALGQYDPAKPRKLGKPLTQMQRLYVNAIVHDGVGKEIAATMAGFAGKASSAVSVLNRNVNIQHAIALEREKYAKASMMTKKRVIDGFLEAIEMAKIQADPTPMIQGWTQIAKMCGYHEPTRHKLEISVQGEVIIQKLQQLSDHELLKLADGSTDVLEGEFSVIEAEEEA